MGSGESAVVVWRLPFPENPYGEKEPIVPGPMAKHPSARARVNKTSTNALLRVVDNQSVPPMPKTRKWRKESVAWWEAIWQSPMRQEFDPSDERVLMRMLALEEAFWSAVEDGDIRTQIAVQAEQRQQEKRFGFSPEDRRRLQWQIEQGEAATEKTTQRRRAKAVKSGPKLVETDPRELLA